MGQFEMFKKCVFILIGLTGFSYQIGVAGADSSPVPQCKSMSADYSKFKDPELGKFEEGKADCQPVLTKLEISASNGTSRDKYLLALCFGHGLGVQKDLKKSMDYLEKSLACGDKTSALAASVLGFIYKNGHFPNPWQGWISNNNGRLHAPNRKIKEEIKPDPNSALKYFHRISGLDRKQSMDANMQIAEIESNLICGSVGEIAPNDCDVEQLANSGSEKDRKVALACACSMNQISQREKECIVKMTHSILKSSATEKLNICDCATGPLGLQCAQRNSETALKSQSTEIEKLQSKWSSEMKKAFVTLQLTADEFRNAQVNWINYTPPGEWGGSGSAAFAVGYDTDIRQAFFDLLKNLEADPNKFLNTSDNLKAEDKILNKNYSSCLVDIRTEGSKPKAKNAKADNDSIKFFRDSQRKWISYRDAWVSFLKVRWKGTATPEHIRAVISQLLTKDRAEDLTYACGRNPDRH